MIIFSSIYKANVKPVTIQKKEQWNAFSFSPYWINHGKFYAALSKVVSTA